MGEQYEIFEGDEPVDRFEVRDLRVKTRFAIDNRFQDDYAHILGPECSMTYYSLVRHANKEQKTWPSQKRIAAQVDQDRQWVGIYLHILQFFNIIRAVRLGKMCTNRYYLIDEKYWRTDFDEMLTHLEQVVKYKQLVKEKGENEAKKVMSPVVTSLPGDIRCHRKLHQMLSKVTSNSKDNQKDKQRRIEKTVKKVKSKSPNQAGNTAPKTVHIGSGSKEKAPIFNEEANIFIVERYD